MFFQVQGVAMLSKPSVLAFSHRTDFIAADVLCQPRFFWERGFHIFGHGAYFGSSSENFRKRQTNLKSLCSREEQKTRQQSRFKDQTIEHLFAEE
jgi:hypothetical protein